MKIQRDHQVIRSSRASRGKANLPLRSFFRKVYLDIIYAAVASNSLKETRSLVSYNTEIFKFSAEIRKNDAEQIGVRNHKQMVKALFIMPHDGQY